MTVAEMLSRFIVSKRAAGASDKTLLWYRSIVGKFDVWWQDKDCPPLTTELMELYFVSLRDRHKRTGEKPLADASVASIYRALRTFFRWCQKKKLVIESPMAELEIMKASPKEPRQATKEEVDLLLSQIPVHEWIGLRDFLIIHVLFFCGLRVGELVRLEAHHFDVSLEVLHIPGGKTGAGLVPLLREVIEAFLAYQTHRPRIGVARLFLSSDGHHEAVGALTEHGVRHMIARRCAEIGIRRLNPHAFRHGLAMHLLNDRRVDASLVQKILRHADIKVTTGTYARWTMAAASDEFKSRMQR